MKSLKTRVATGALAGAMALSLAVPAFAAAPTTKVTASYAEVAIDVTVPTAGTATLNPLGMPVTLVEKTTKSDAVIASGQIANAPLYIQNNMDMKLAVRATVSTATKITLVNSWPETEPTDKTACVYLQVTGATAKSGSGATAVDLLNDKGVINETALAMQAAAVEYSDSVTDSTDGAAVVFLVNGEGTKPGESSTAAPEGETKKASMLELAAKSETKNGTTTYNAGAIGIFGLYGKMVEEPQNSAGASDPWAKTDSITATIAWQFSVVK